MASQIRLVTASVKAFESLKKNMEQERHKRALSVEGLLHRAHTLKLKAVQAFKMVIARNHKREQFEMSRQTRVCAHFFAAWEDQH